MLTGIIKDKNHMIDYLNSQIKTLSQPITSISTSGKVSAKDEIPVVEVNGKQKETTTIAYVPKVTLPNGEKEKTDLQVIKTPPKVNVEIGGKKFDLPSSIKEETKLENGKIVLTEENQINFKITTPKEIARLAIGKSNNGLSGAISGNISGVVGGVIYIDSKSKSFMLSVPLSK